MAEQTVTLRVQVDADGAVTEIQGVSIAVRNLGAEATNAGSTVSAAFGLVKTVLDAQRAAKALSDIGSGAATAAAGARGFDAVGRGLLSVLGGWPGAALAAGGALLALWDWMEDGERAVRAPLTALQQLNGELERRAKLNDLIASGRASESNAPQVLLIEEARKRAADFARELEVSKQKLEDFSTTNAGDQASIAVLRDMRTHVNNVGESLELANKVVRRNSDLLAENAHWIDLGTVARRQIAQETEAFRDSLSGQIDGLRLENEELQHGLRARLELEAVTTAGVKSADQLDQKTRNLINTRVAEAETNERLKSSQQAAIEAKEQAKRADEALTEAATKFTEKAEQQALVLAGPAAQAAATYREELDEGARLFVAGKISADQLTQAIAVQAEVLDRATEAAAARRTPVQQMLDDLDAEAKLIGLVGTAREVAIARQKAEQALKQQGIALSSEEAKQDLALIEGKVRSNAALTQTAEAAKKAKDASAKAAEEYKNAWKSATDSVARAFGNFASGSIKSFKSLGQQLKSIAQRFLGDLVTTFISSKLQSTLSGLFGRTRSSGNFPPIGSVGDATGQAGASAAGNMNIWAALAVQAEQDLRAALSGPGGTGAKVRNLLLGAVIGAGAANKLNSLTGGGLFGTKFTTDTSGIDFTIGAGGAAGLAFDNQKKKKALFGGTKRRTVETSLDSAAQQAIDDLFNAIGQSVAAAAGAFGIEVPALIAGRFRQTLDKNGNLKDEFSEIAGRVFKESREAFAKRLQAENAINVIDIALSSSPVSSTENEASKIAERWRADASKLLDGAQFLLSASVDLKEGFGLLGTGGTLTDITALVEDINKAGEPLVDTYLRLTGGTRLLDEALKLSSVSIDLGREQFVRLAAGIVEAAGGLDKATSLWRGYFNRFFSDNERATQALETARQAAQSQLSDVGLSAADFTGADGLAKFRELFEQALPTATAEAIVQWLEAAQALGVVVDAQEAFNQTLGDTTQSVDEAARALAEQLASMLDNVHSQASDAADALADFGLSDLAVGLQQVARDTDRAVAEATRLGASESDLAEIRALGAARTELLQRKAQADLANLLDGVGQSLFELDATPLEVEIVRIQRATQDMLTQATELGASEEQLARIRALGARQSANAIEAEVGRMREAFAQLAQSIGQTRQSIAGDILGIQRTQPGFSESGFQSGRLADLRAQLDATDDPQQRIELIDQIREATLARYNAELASINETAQAQQQAGQAAQQAIEAQRQALDRLRGFVDTLGLSSNSPLTAFQRLDVAQSVFDQTLTRARSGDVEAIGSLQEAASALLTENRNVFGVSDQAVRTFEQVRSAVSSVAGQGVRGAAAISDPFQRASLDTSSRIAQLQEGAIAELQGLDDALAMLELTQRAESEGSIEALRARYDQAERHNSELIENILPFLDVLSADATTGTDQLGELRAQTQALADLVGAMEGQQGTSSAFLDKFLVFMKQIQDQGDQQQAEMGRMALAIEAAVRTGARA